VLLGVAVLLAGIPFGLLLHQVATDGPVTGFDEDVAADLNERAHDVGWLVTAMEAVSFLGKPAFLFVLVGAVVVWLSWRRARRLAMFLVVTCLGGGIVNSLVKLAVGRARPEVDEPIAEAFGKSFPSGHAMGSTICYGALVVALVPLLPRRARRPAAAAVAVLVGAIGASRLVLGVHFLSDVLGGFVLGAAWLAGAVAIFEAYRADRGRRRTGPVEEGIEPEEAAALVDSST
jgi:undecaprenyl-diphosphatase